jgi:hypothetical protein
MALGLKVKFHIYFGSANDTEMGAFFRRVEANVPILGTLKGHFRGFYVPKRVVLSISTSPYTCSKVSGGPHV